MPKKKNRTLKIRNKKRSLSKKSKGKRHSRTKLYIRKMKGGMENIYFICHDYQVIDSTNNISIKIIIGTTENIYIVNKYHNIKDNIDNITHMGCFRSSENGIPSYRDRICLKNTDDTTFMSYKITKCIKNKNKNMYIITCEKITHPTLCQESINEYQSHNSAPTSLIIAPNQFKYKISTPINLKFVEEKEEIACTINENGEILYNSNGVIGNVFRATDIEHYFNRIIINETISSISKGNYIIKSIQEHPLTLTLI